MRVSVAQILSGHDECTIPLIYTLNQMGIYVDVYINNELRVKRGNIFESLCIRHSEFYINQSTDLNDLPPPLPSNRVFWLGVMGNKVKKLIRHNLEYSLPLMFWTTFAKNPSALFEYCREIGFHVYAFVHDAGSYQVSSVLADMNNVTPVVFSQGMVNAFSNHDHLNALKFYLPPLSNVSENQTVQRKDIGNSREIRIAVPGRVAYARRDYQLLVDFASSLISAKMSGTEPRFIIAGGVSGEDGRKFIDYLSSKNLFRYFECPFTCLASNDAPFMSYNQLFSILVNCDMAISNSLAVKGDYTKVSGAINLCINFQLPVLYLTDFSLYPEFDDMASLTIDPLDAAQVQSFASEINQLIGQKKEQTFFLKQAMEKWNLQVLKEILSSH